MDINKLIKEATLNKNGAAKEAFRAIKAELLLNNSSKNPRPEGKSIGKLVYRSENPIISLDIEINELDLSIIRKLIKEREEQISMYEANSRKELANMYREQMTYLKMLLPPEISKDKIQEFITIAYPNGFSQKEMGKIIKEVKETYPTADGKVIAETVKEYLL